ncbi:hypothetical protein ACEQPO_25440 [Bacillus sp. SL00103]
MKGVGTWEHLILQVGHTGRPLITMYTKAITIKCGEARREPLFNMRESED